ncbi:hypothetical protein [Rhodohalobacter sp. 614A]|nr:hypothetical protein [Rhodohalobacter sp. 614A]
MRQYSIHLNMHKIQDSRVAILYRAQILPYFEICGIHAYRIQIEGAKKAD